MTTTKTTKKPRAAKAVKKEGVQTSETAASVSVHRTFTGKVTRISGKQTVRVEVKTVKMHEKFRKQYVIMKAFLVHDEHMVAKVGDIVRFEECRPISKKKRWRIRGVITASV